MESILVKITVLAIRPRSSQLVKFLERVYRFLESRDSFIALLTAETWLILNNRLHGGAFILPNDITDIKESRLS